jgi:hypothetical protein
MNWFRIFIWLNLDFNQTGNDEKKFAVFLFYPYFMESWIEKWLPEFKMLDYKVDFIIKAF